MTTPNVKDFPSLIRWIAEAYHDGAVMHVGESVGISQATAAKWANARAVPTVPKILALCDAYKLDLYRVVDLVKATKPPKLRGLLGAAALALALGSGRVEPATLPTGPEDDGTLRNHNAMSLIGSWLRRLNLWVCVLPRTGWVTA